MRYFLYKFVCIKIWLLVFDFIWHAKNYAIKSNWITKFRPLNALIPKIKLYKKSSEHFPMPSLAFLRKSLVLFGLKTKCKIGGRTVSGQHRICCFFLVGRELIKLFFKKNLCKFFFCQVRMHTNSLFSLCVEQSNKTV